MDDRSLELQPEQLRRTLDPQSIDLAQLTPAAIADGIIGQPRAVAALHFGLNMRDGGYNIYVAGPPGSGKMTTARAFIAELASHQPTPGDWCYLNNFDDPYQPIACALPAGAGRRLQQDMQALVEHARREIPRAFESDEYTARRDELMKELNRQRDQLLGEFSAHAEREGFAFQITQFGMLLVPLAQGRPLNEGEFEALPEEQRADFIRRRELMQDELKVVMKRGRAIERGVQAQLEELDHQVALSVVGGLVEDLEEQYAAHPAVTAYLAAVRQDILAHIELFRPAPAPRDVAATAGAEWSRELALRRYGVNVLVDNSKQRGAPVVVDLHPTYGNLCGRIEKESQFGALHTDFTLIKAGVLHQANGGFLVLSVEDLLRDPLGWDGLKQALRSGVIEIEDPIERMGFMSTRSLRPQPIPFVVKIILVGPPLIYALLHAYDSEFPELFKVKADFDTTMEWNAQNERDTIVLLLRFGQQAQLRPPEAAALAALVEASGRRAEDQRRLSTQFATLTDLLREADFYAAQAGAAQIARAHVEQAIEARIYRANLIEERIQDLVADGSLLVETSGARMGAINGLAVIGLGDYQFGRPSRISATAAPGREGLIDIERTVKLGGPLHSKGVLILNGYLLHTYAQSQPLSLSARLTFEQSYEGIEGDSASAAELCALLSALAGLPIDQGIAMTGSVNQHGQVQAIGGVNAKVEGFFTLCRMQGPTGRQGVIIPRSNVQNLMLRAEVIEAVRAGQFHIWPVGTVDEAIALLTGTPAGERGFDGHFPANTCNGRVEQRLAEFASALEPAEGA